MDSCCYHVSNFICILETNKPVVVTRSR